MSATRSRAHPGGGEVLRVLGGQVRPLRERKPPWLKVAPPGGERSWSQNEARGSSPSRRLLLGESAVL